MRLDTPNYSNARTICWDCRLVFIGARWQLFDRDGKLRDSSDRYNTQDEADAAEQTYATRGASVERR
ncbi:MAG: hypothetical protein KGL35_13890 [Bradyrhizobium sp.]|nr:hypothetical protein [Bradyrhizobium sp.]